MSHGRGDPADERYKKIFVGGLPRDLDIEVFKQYFEQFGPLTDYVVMKDRETGRQRGFGFVTYQEEEAV